MKIGIDLDGVVLDTEKQFRNAAELYDMNILKKNSLINNQEIIIENRYNWSNETLKNFYKENLVKCTEKSSAMPGAKEVIELLKKDGHELILITARGGEYPEMIDAGKRILEKEKISFDKYYWKADDKTEICKKENIDLMIEDKLENCEGVANANIKAIYLRDSNMKPSNNPNIKEVYLWAEIYRYIKELEN